MNSTLSEQTMQAYRNKYQLAKQKLCDHLQTILPSLANDHPLSVLVHLQQKATLQEVEKLKRLGLRIPVFFTFNTPTCIPGTITRFHLEQGLIHCDFVKQVEGTALPQIKKPR